MRRVQAPIRQLLAAESVIVIGRQAETTVLSACHNTLTLCPLPFRVIPLSTPSRPLAMLETKTLARGGFMLAIIAAVLVVLWLLGFLAFHVSSGFIHLLLILAVISVIAHFFRGRTSPA